MSGRREPSMSASRANRKQAFVRRRMNEGDERARLLGSHDRRPVDGRLERRARQPQLFEIEVAEKLTAGEDVIDVGEILRLVVAEAANGKRRVMPRARARAIASKIIG